MQRAVAPRAGQLRVVRHMHMDHAHVIWVLVGVLLHAQHLGIALIKD